LFLENLYQARKRAIRPCHFLLENLYQAKNRAIKACHFLLENLYQVRKWAIKPPSATCYWRTCTKPGNERSSPHLPLVIGEPVPSQEMSNQALITRRKYVPCKWMMTRSFKATTDSRLLGVIVPDPSHHPLFVTLKATSGTVVTVIVW
jgi:hypothetical protein